MSAWGRGSERPRSGVGFMVWIVVGMTLGMVISIGAVLIAYPGIDISEVQELEQLRTELDNTRAKLLEQDKEIETLRARAGSGDGAGTGDSTQDPSERIQLLESQNVQMADEIRVLNGRLEVAQQITEEMQAALDKAPVGDVGDLKKQLQERDESLAQLDAGYAELIAKVDGLTTERDRLRQELAAKGETVAPNQSAGSVGAAGQAGSSSDAARLQTALTAAEVKAAELQKQADDAKAAIAGRDKALQDLDAEISRLAPLEAEVANLRQRLAAAGNSAASSPNEAELKSNLDRAETEALSLRQELAAAVSKRDAAEALAGERERELAAARLEVAGREKALKDLDVEISRLAPLEADVARLRSELAAAQAATQSADRTEADAKLAAAEAEAQRLAEELATAQGKLETAAAIAETQEEELAQARDALAKSEAAVADAKAAQERLQQEIARLSSGSESQSGASQSRQDTDGQAATDRAPTPRDPLLVARAMQETPGLGSLDAQGRDRLATDLIEGECVAKSLTEVFGRAPAPTVRDLILKLQSDC